MVNGDVLGFGELRIKVREVWRGNETEGMKWELGTGMQERVGVRGGERKEWCIREGRIMIVI